MNSRTAHKRPNGILCDRRFAALPFPTSSAWPLLLLRATCPTFFGQRCHPGQGMILYLSWWTLEEDKCPLILAHYCDFESGIRHAKGQRALFTYSHILLYSQGLWSRFRTADPPLPRNGRLGSHVNRLQDMPRSDRQFMAIMKGSITHIGARPGVKICAQMCGIMSDKYCAKFNILLMSACASTGNISLILTTDGGTKSVRRPPNNLRHSEVVACLALSLGPRTVYLYSS
jgi:hypothetical protein